MPASGAEVPEFQPLPAQLTGLWRKRRDLAARAASDGLRVALPGLAGRWVEIILSNDPAEARDTLPDISFVGPDGRPGTVLPQEARGGGAFAWIGCLPEDVVELRVADPAGRVPVRLRRIAVRRLARPVLAARGLLRDPGLTVQAFTWRSLGKKVRARGFLLYPGKLTQVETFRVGCIGALDARDLEKVVAAVGDSLRALGIVVDE